MANGPEDPRLAMLEEIISRMTGIPQEVLHNMSRQEMERALIGDDLSRPAEGNYTEIHEDDSEY